MKRFILLICVFILLCITKISAQPILSSPANGTSGITSTSITCSWSLFSGATVYNFEISTTSDFSSNVTYDYGITGLTENVTGLIPGTSYYWRVRATVGGNYTAYSSVWSFSTLPNPVASFTAVGTTNVCAGINISFNNSSTNATSYSWSFLGGTPSSSTVANPTVIYNSSGTYSVSLIVYNAVGSNIQTRSNYFTVKNNPIAQISVTGNTTKCPKDTITLTALPVGYPYLWSTGDTARTIKKTGFGLYTLSITQVSSGCTSIANVSVTRDSTLVTNLITSNKTKICYNDSVLLTGNSGYSSYLWSNNSSTSQTYAKTSGTFYLAALIDSFQCPVKGSISLAKTYPTFKISTQGLASTLCYSDSVTLISPSGFTSFLWNTSAISPTIKIGNPGMYNLIATDSIGCKAFDSTTISYTKTICFNGTYTVGGTNPNFQTIQKAYDSLAKSRMSGPVIFNIRPGTYTDPLRFNSSVSGLNYINTLTFQAENGVTGSVVVSCADTVGLAITNNNYLKFKNLVFDNRGSLLFNNIYLRSTSYCEFYNNKFYTNFDPLTIISNFYSDNSSIKNIFSGNYFSGGTYGLTARANAKVISNTFDSVYTAISISQLNYSDTVIIKKNTVNSFSSLGGSYPAIYLSSGGSSSTHQSSLIFDKNKVNCLGELISAYYFKNAQITNNNLCGKLTLQTCGLKFYNNNIYLIDYTQPIYIKVYNSGDSLRFSNNNIYQAPSNDPSSLLLTLDTTNAVPNLVKEFDNNNYFYDSLSGFNKFQILGTNSANYTTFSQWKSGFQKDLNSMSVNPNFASTTDLTTHNVLLAGHGKAHTEVIDDIRDIPRSTVQPSIGSYEYSTNRDLSFESILFNNMNCTGSKYDPIYAVLKNQSVTINVNINDSVRVGFVVNGIPFSKKVIFYKSLTFLDTIALKISDSIDLSQPGPISIKAWLNYSNDLNPNNDTTNYSYSLLQSPKANFKISNACVNQNLTITDSSYTNSGSLNYKWTFNDGSSFTTKSFVKNFSVSGNKNVSLVVTNSNGCRDNSVKSFSIYPLPVATITRSGDTLISSPETQYRWSKDGSNLPNDTNQILFVKQKGNYVVTTINAYGCSNVSSPYNFNFNGINETKDDNKILIYPNPFSNSLSIESTSEIRDVKIYNQIGELLFENHGLKKEMILVNTEYWSNGLYVIQVSTSENGMIRYKVVKYNN